jgi:hypothetical protein
MARKGQELLTMMMDPAKDGREAIGHPTPHWSWISDQFTPLLVDVLVFAGPEASRAARAFSDSIILMGDGANGDLDTAHTAYARYLEFVRSDLGVATLNADAAWPEPGLWKRQGS